VFQGSAVEATFPAAVELVAPEGWYQYEVATVLGTGTDKPGIAAAVYTDYTELGMDCRRFHKDRDCRIEPRYVAVVVAGNYLEEMHHYYLPCYREEERVPAGAVVSGLAEGAVTE
jgi:hypothetical protein